MLFSFLWSTPKKPFQTDHLSSRVLHITNPFANTDFFSFIHWYPRRERLIYWECCWILGSCWINRWHSCPGVSGLSERGEGMAVRCSIILCRDQSPKNSGEKRSMDIWGSGGSWFGLLVCLWDRGTKFSVYLLTLLLKKPPSIKKIGSEGPNLWGPKEDPLSLHYFQWREDI